MRAACSSLILSPISRHPVFCPAWVAAVCYVCCVQPNVKNGKEYKECENQFFNKNQFHFFFFLLSSSPIRSSHPRDKIRNITFQSAQRVTFQVSHFHVAFELFHTQRKVCDNRFCTNILRANDFRSSCCFNLSAGLWLLDGNSTVIVKMSCEEMWRARWARPPLRWNVGCLVMRRNAVMDWWNFWKWLLLLAFYHLACPAFALLLHTLIN